MKAQEARSDLDLPPLRQAVGGLPVRAAPRVLGRLVALALRHRGLCSAAVLCALGTALLNLVLPQLLGRGLDESHRVIAAQGPSHTSGSAPTALWITGALLVGAATLRGLLTGLQGYLGESIAQHVGNDLRVAFFDRLQRLDAAFHDVNHSADLITRGMLDLEGVRGFLETGLLRVIALVPLLGFGAWRLIGTDPTLGLLALSFVPFVMWRAARMGLMLRLSWQRLQRLMSELTLRIEENLQGQRVVRAFAAQGAEIHRHDGLAADVLALSESRGRLRFGATGVMNFAFYAAMALVLYVGGRRVAQGTMTIGLLGEFLTFMTLLQQPVRQIGMIVNASTRAAGAGARLFEVLDAQPRIVDATQARPLVVTAGVLRFEGVSFAHAGADERRGRVDDIEFTLRPGEVLGIVGPPGSGKSTIASLMLRQRDAAAGRITIDGQDIRDVTLDSLRQAVAGVPQDAFLFDGSVQGNVAYAAPHAPTAAIVEAATTAQLHEQLMQWPDAYKTRVGERGVALSGGQKQRLSIARGLLTRPRILVLDDASSALDATTSHRLRVALREALSDTAVVLISHQLATLCHADEILVMEHGRIAERGTHDSLLAQRGRYAALWALQHGEAVAGANAGQQDRDHASSEAEAEAEADAGAGAGAGGSGVPAAVST